MSRKSSKQRTNRKRDIYAQYGIEYDPKSGKIYNSMFGWVRPLLINGNGKLGRGVYTFSTLAGNKWYNVVFENGDRMEIKGTCCCNCKGCYAQTGRYGCANVIAANARKTVIIRLMLEWFERAILAQIAADGIRICRIHASGDFDSVEYVEAWHRIIEATPQVIYWSYTKYEPAQAAFDDLHNMNMVKSLTPFGMNYGHAGYIIGLYNALKALGRRVYVCRCGIDRNQHCTNCNGCFDNEFTLFLEHSTEYNPENDPDFPAFVALVEAQEMPTAA